MDNNPKVMTEPGDMVERVEAWVCNRWPNSHDYPEREAAREAYAAALAASGADRMREALEECLRQIEKYAEFFCEEDFDPTVDLVRQALGEPQ